MKSVISGIALVALAGTAYADLTANFEAPAYSASAAGTLLTGQNAWYVPVAGSVDWLAFTYAGNTWAVSQNPAGGSQFAGGQSTGTFARAEIPHDFSTGSAWTVTWDVTGLFVGTPPAANNLGSFSFQPAGTTVWQSLYNFMDNADPNGAGWAIRFMPFNAGGTQTAQPGVVPSSAFESLIANRWYRVSVWLSFDQNRIHEVTLTDLTTNTTTTTNPQGWFLGGGQNNSQGLVRASAMRHFIGGPLGNTMAVDNMVVAPAAEPPPPPPPPPPPANDLCADATVVGEGSFPWTTASATNDGGGTCGNSFSSPDVWYTYTPTFTGTAVISTCGGTGTPDTVLGIFDACQGAEFACDDDGCDGQFFGSRIELGVFTGQPWLIRVAEAGGVSGGSGTLTIRQISPPANDMCANATNVGEGVHSFTLVDATNDGSSTCGTSETAADVWLRYTPSADGTATVSSCNLASFDQVLSAFDACGGAELACDDDGCTVGGGPSTFNVAVTAGNPILIRICEFDGGAYSSGQVSITLPPPPPQCDADVNCDGSPDQGDVACMILAVAGDTSCICQDPDFNLDGSADQGDVAAIIGVVAGAPCP